MKIRQVYGREWPLAVLVILVLMVGACSAPSQAPGEAAAAPNAPSASQGEASVGQNAVEVAALPKEVDLEQAAAKRDAGAFILDVRQPEEWNEYHVPGSTLIPLAELQNRLNEVPKDKEVVVVCRSGNRSATGRDVLLKAGYPQVTSLAGGLSQWKAKGLPTVTGP